jgi:DNA-binding protein H-NS
LAVKRINLKALSFDELLALRDNAEALIAQRVAEEKKALEERLSRLSSLAGGKGRKAATSALKGRKAAPKYRNPENPEETWAGRGMTPRWLQALLEQGHSIEEFAIEGASAEAGAPAKRGRPRKSARRKAATGKKGASKKTRRTRKAA